jgi:hypothetical protein
MELDADEEVVAEYPLYVASFGALSNQEDIRLAQVQYPLRPTWRGYRIVDATEVRYKPNHRILDISVPEDEASTVCTSICFFLFTGSPRGLPCNMQSNCAQGSRASPCSS